MKIMYKCKDCIHFIQDIGVLSWREAKNSLVIGCVKGAFTLTHNLVRPITIIACLSYEKGEDVMSDVDFDNDSPDVIRRKIEAIRRERSGVAKRAVTKAKNRRIAKVTKVKNKRHTIERVE